MRTPKKPLIELKPDDSEFWDNPIAAIFTEYPETDGKEFYEKYVRVFKDANNELFCSLKKEKR